MLSISKQQMIALAATATENFDQRMAAYVREFFPDTCKTLTQSDIAEAIRYGRHRAATYGIIVEADVCKYISLMIAFGRDFEDTAELSWTSAILYTPASSPSDRINSLCDAALAYVSANTEKEVDP